MAAMILVVAEKRQLRSESGCYLAAMILVEANKKAVTLWKWLRHGSHDFSGNSFDTEDRNSICTRIANGNKYRTTIFKENISIMGP